MRKRFLICTLVFCIISIIILVIEFKFSEANNDFSISLMYTNKEYVANYGLYNVKKKTLQDLYNRKNEHYSDYIIDEKNNKVYYSELANKKYNIYELNLLDKHIKSVDLGDYSADIFSLQNSKLIFRTIGKDKKYTIGTNDLINKEMYIWDIKDEDSLIYNFYHDVFDNRVYTIERSRNEMISNKFEDIPTHKIIQYDENGAERKLIYSTKKFINNISVNSAKDKILFDASDIDNNAVINKIYLINLNKNSEEILIKPDDLIENHKFTLIKKPKFSPDNRGFYFLGSTTQSNIIEDTDVGMPIYSNALYYYEFSSKKITKIFENKDAIINDFKIQ